MAIPIPEVSLDLSLSSL